MRYSIPPTLTDRRAADRHRDGVSCKTPTIYTYDANGSKRWCADCGVELDERSWHPDGVEPSPKSIGLFGVAVFVVMGLVAIALLLVCLGPAEPPPIPLQTPVTHSTPTWYAE